MLDVVLLLDKDPQDEWETPCSFQHYFCSSWWVRCCFWILHTSVYTASLSNCGCHNTGAVKRERMTSHVQCSTPSEGDEASSNQHEILPHLSLNIVDGSTLGIAVGATILVIHSLDGKINFIFNLGNGKEEEWEYSLEQGTKSECANTIKTTVCQVEHYILSSSSSIHSRLQRVFDDTSTWVIQYRVIVNTFMLAGLSCSAGWVWSAGFKVEHQTRQRKKKQTWQYIWLSHLCSVNISKNHYSHLCHEHQQENDDKLWIEF